MSYKIGSFNLRNIGKTSLGNNNLRDLSKIAEIIKNEQFDVVALQEVLSTGKALLDPEQNPECKAVKQCIMMELGADYSFEWANAETDLKDLRNEGYAFIWNNKKLKLPVTTLTDRTKRTFHPRICRINKEYLHRKPYYARFTPVGTLVGGPRCELRLLCIHTYFGKDTKLEHNLRQRELEVLMTDVYPQISDRVYGMNMPNYTILLGDYNVELRREWKDESRARENERRKSEGKAPLPKPATLVADKNDVVESTKWGLRRIKTVQDQYTTLKSISNSKENTSSKISERGYAHDYDHFSFEESKFEGVNMKVKRIDAVRKYCEDDFEKYYKTISDHIPIMMEIELK